ncbi:MAG: bifunctional homocysteine S-methyltransferase/methylenetetrahydrofolate reductase [Deltaproteobacteria bacterium]|nr:bifunctional homocysteine S-methyltransferase/methylenetetrahydrofolate reductase [Deltaproteobacteria bacterium]
MSRFRDAILQKKPLLFDGAIGTELYNRGIFINRCFEDANLSSEELVLAVHRDYLKAGANIITTNSWGANRIKLREHNLDDKLKLINIKAVELARKIAQDDAFVAGSVGPLGVRIEPFGPTSFQEARAFFAEQIAALVEGGVDLISLETFADLSEIQQAILATRDVAPEIPLIASVTMTQEGKSPLGTPIPWIMQKLDEWETDVLGLNCSVGPQPMMSAVETIRNLVKKPLCIQPNAGLPKSVEGRQIYMCTPEYMAHFAKEFLNAGVLIVGGCCGTTPEHIRAMSNSIRFSRAFVRVSVEEKPKQAREAELVEEQPRVPFAEKSKWSRKIAEGVQVSSVELLPPAGIDPAKIIESSVQIHKAGVDAINIPDGPRASARMSAILTAVMIEQKAKIETVLHYTCRDRNLLSMQSDLLGAQAIGLRNMLLVTGDPPRLGSYPNATGVFDVDSIGLTNMVYRLNGGIDLGGRSIGKPASLSIGVGVNPVHHDFAFEMNRFAWKVDAGAEWAITQPVFDLKALYRFLEYIEAKNIRIPIIAGIWPLISYRNAVFMNNEVPGVVIPTDIMERMAAVKDPEDSKKVGVEIARTMVEELGKSVQGFQVSAPFGRIDLALNVLGK